MRYVVYETGPDSRNSSPGTEELRRLLDEARTRRNAPWQEKWSLAMGGLMHAAGENEAAMSHLKEAAVLFAEIGVDAGTYRPEIWKLVEW